MDANDTNIISAVKSDKKTLLERYDIPVEHLSYEYISECKDGKMLERIVTILRSGQEGFYPDLTRHAEERLAIVKPTSIILRKSEPIIKRSMLDPNECKEIDKDINNWTSEMQSREKDLEEGKAVLTEDPILQPDIRQFNNESLQQKNEITNSKSTSKVKRIASCDYAAWNKYDVDTELNKIDIRDEQKLAEAKRLQQKQKEITHKKKLEKNTIINRSSLTGTELNVMAEQEREKGNEAFRAGDYEEALEHYNTSIKIDSNILAYNNRAMTFIKLRRYQDAYEDCNFVISMDSTNIKALLRRAVALEHLEKSSQALIDYEAVLKLEPTNPAAIAGVKKLRKPSESRKVRMNIEEQKEITNEDPKLNEVLENKYREAQFQSKLNIENICYCNRVPGVSLNLSPRPHFKTNYCLENEEKFVVKNNNSKKSITAKNATFSLNSTNLLQEKRSSPPFTNPKSIFSCAMPSKRNNSVIIEELSSEPRSNNSADNKNKSSYKTTKEYNLNMSTANKQYDCESKRIYKLNAKNLNTEVSPTKIRIPDKYENKTSKSEKCNLKNIDNIENGYEFMRVWQSLKNDTNLEMHAQLLRSLNVDKLDAVLGNELDGNMFSIILHCLDQHFCTPDDTKLLNDFLKSFSQMKRFSILNMFLSTEDKQVIKNILNFLEEHGTSEVSSLRQIYCI
ncbi:spag1 axonemal dynein assembly factor [Calliopsis andreniformis]|uniref:spag1 axonemal dynein assembly factor n=1 Tax=Calliopsis andreniformis TaxID=337506 RepID=UPI003FCD3B60